MRGSVGIDGDLAGQTNVLADLARLGLGRHDAEPLHLRGRYADDDLVLPVGVVPLVAVLVGVLAFVGVVVVIVGALAFVRAVVVVLRLLPARPDLFDSGGLARALASGTTQPGAARTATRPAPAAPAPPARPTGCV